MGGVAAFGTSEKYFDISWTIFFLGWVGDCEESSFFLLSPAVLTEMVEIFADFLIFMVFFANGVADNVKFTML